METDILYKKAPSNRNEPNSGATGKRLDYISWHQHHMYMAKALMDFCKDNDNDKAACIIVDQEHHPLATGYQGEMVSGRTTTSPHDSHPEAIALFFKKQRKPENCTLYTTRMPTCSICVDLICQEKIQKLYYLGDSSVEIEEKLRKNDVICEKYVTTRTIEIDIKMGN